MLLDIVADGCVEQKVKMSSAASGFTPLVTVVDFHHARSVSFYVLNQCFNILIRSFRGPEVESWFGAEEGTDPAEDYGWGLLPFMALSDGAHA